MRPDTVVSASLIREARMRAGLTQAQLSERCGKAKVQIGRWETGAVAPSLDTLLELVRACGFDLPLMPEPYQPVDDRRLTQLQRASPERRVQNMLRRLETRREQMSSDGAQTRFNPRAMLVALQRREVDFILIGGLARVARGADEITRDLDICPSLQPISLGRLQAALIELGVVSPDVIGGPPLQHVYDEARLRAEKVISLPTVVGELKLVAAPAGVPRGYEALRAGATSEHLGGGLRIEIASTADLITMAAALRRPEDVERLPALRQILKLEADRAALVGPSIRTPSSTQSLRRPRNVGSDRAQDPDVGR